MGAEGFDGGCLPQRSSAGPEGGTSSSRQHVGVSCGGVGDERRRERCAMGAVRRLHPLKLATARLTEGEGGLALQSRESPAGPPICWNEQRRIASRAWSIAQIVKQEPDMQLLVSVPSPFVVASLSLTVSSAHTTKRPCDHGPTHPATLPLPYQYSSRQHLPALRAPAPCDFVPARLPIDAPPPATTRDTTSPLPRTRDIFTAHPRAVAIRHGQDV